MVQPIIMISMPRTADANRDRATLSYRHHRSARWLILRYSCGSTWRAISSSSWWNRRRSSEWDTVREKEQWHTHIHIRDICICIYGVAAFGHFSFRRVVIGGHNRFKATDVLPAAVGRIVLSLPLDVEVSRAKRHFSSGRISLEDRRRGSGRSVRFASRRLNGEIDSWNMGSMRVEHLAPRLRS